MGKVTISVNDVIDIAKSEPGLTPFDLRYLEVLRAAWFTCKVRGSVEFSKRLRAVLSQHAIKRILQQLLSTADYEQLLSTADYERACEAEKKKVAETLIAMSLSS